MAGIPRAGRPAVAIARAARPASAPAAGIGGTVAQSPVAQEPAIDIDIGAVPAIPTATPSQAPVPASASSTAVVLPTPDANALPSKGTQFVYDEYGILDPKIVADAERQMYDHAKQHGVEIVTMLVKDLHGMTAEQYGWAMMRQLRVGKLDVGNGAVLVLAPDQGAAAAVMGPGVALEMAHQDKGAQLQRWIESAWPQCKRKNACGNWTENMLLAADHIRRDTDDWEWTVRYQSLGDMLKQSQAENGQSLRPQDSKVWHKIVRFGGTVVDLAPKPGIKAVWVDGDRVTAGRPAKAVHVRSDEGLTVVLYLDPRTEGLMPGGALQAGKRYVFTGRESFLSWNPKDTQAIDLLSYVQAR